MDELYQLLSELSEVDSEVALFTAQRDSLRARISELVDQAGGKVTIEGLARAEIRAPVIVEAFDKGALLELITSLTESGYAPIADEIRACVKRTMRAGTLVVTMERKARA